MLIPGIGKAKASALDAALELGRRRVRGKGRTIVSPGDIFNEIRHFASRQQEHLLSILFLSVYLYLLFLSFSLHTVSMHQTCTMLP